MATSLESKDRNVIPRWRDFSSTAALGELASTNAASPRQRRTIHTSDVEFDWKQNPTLSFAGDLISGAWVSGNLEVAREAAEFVLQSAARLDVGQSLCDLALKVLGKKDPGQPEVATGISNETRTQIAIQRKMLNLVPRDPVRWVDLSLLYAQQGLLAKAERAILIALNLAPKNRFVLRSAARFFMHSKDAERAHELLRRSPLLRTDPWITSAELAVAGALKRIPFGVDFGRKILTSTKFEAYQTSELSAAFATLEFREGDVRKTKRYIASSLAKPNDNSLAQAQWLSPNIGGLPLHNSVVDFGVPRSYEAQAWENFQACDWHGSMTSSIKWLRDEPFASRPTQFAVYSASLLEDFAMSEKLARFGLIANPQYEGFHVSLAFGFAMRDRLDEAEAELERVKAFTEPWTAMQILANRGLIAFRKKQFELGRKLYSEAIEDAAGRKDTLNASAAMIFWAREEIRIDSALGLALLDEAGKLVDHKEMPQYDFLIRQSRERAQEKEISRSLSRELIAHPSLG